MKLPNFSSHWAVTAHNIWLSFNPLNPGQFTRRCTAYPDRSAITSQYQYWFFGSINSGNYYISPTSIFIAHWQVPCIPPFLSQNPIFWLYYSSTLSITWSEYRYLHIHWVSPPYFLRKFVYRVQKPVSKLYIVRKLNKLELSTCDLSVAWYLPV